MQSRYYNPEIGRFISKDDSGYHDASNPIDSNLYTYVNNNPIINTDPNGHFINTILGGVFGAGFGWLSAKLTGGNPQAGAISGAVGGALAGAGADLAVAFPAIGALATTIAAYASSFVSQIIYIGMSKENLDAKYFTRPEVMGSIIFFTILGGIFNVMGAKWSDSLGYGKLPAGLIDPLKRVLYICNLSIQDVRNSIAGSTIINLMFSDRQLVINQIYDYLE